MTRRSRRLLVNAFLVAFLAVLGVDGFRACNGAHQTAKDALNLPLLVTGLWQGPWRLYAPDVPKDNLRFKADVVFADQATATWTSPDWVDVSALRKFVLARHLNYFNNLAPAGAPAWNGLCAYLARSVPHPQGKPADVVQVTLSLRGAKVPPPGERPVAAAPYLAFDDWEVVTVWRPGA